MLKALCLLAIFIVAATGHLMKDASEDADKFLLPWNIRPQHYNITLFTHIENFVDSKPESFVFEGIASITISVLYDDVSDIVIHGKEISFKNFEIKPVANCFTPYETHIGEYDEETNKQILSVSPPLTKNARYILVINYTGINNEELRGFYRSSFEDNGTKWLVTTHFESFGARQAFPCFDEPEYKATYQLTIHYSEELAKAGYIAHSNTAIDKEEIINGVHVTTFKITPRPLSTYLVALILAPFKISPEPAFFNSSFNGENEIKPMYTIGQPKYFSPRQDLLSQIAGPAALNAMTKLTGVGYGMPKMENAGIPDFAPGAMENYGMVTFRESAVFWDEISGTTSQKQSVVSTITHEFGHQWFGDLVTLHWWSDLWLNEGFATFFAAHAADEFRDPSLDTSSWDLIGQFLVGTTQQGAFVSDAKPNSRALTYDAYDPELIDTFFDAISYDKGGSVLRMWLHSLGKEIFYNGLNRYLHSQAQTTGTPTILLASFDGAIDDTDPAQRPVLPGMVSHIFAAWHLQAGYPVLNVSRDGNVLEIKQERFFSSPGTSSAKWNVPISYSTDLEQNYEDTKPITYALATEKSTLLHIGNSAANWVVLNNQATGFYRVNYDAANWNALIQALNNNDTIQLIHPYNRAQILDDAANLGASTNRDYLEYSTVFELMLFLRNERNPIVWFTALKIMRDLNMRLASGTKTRDRFTSYLQYLIEPTFNEIGLEVQAFDDHLTKLLRMKLGPFACSIGLQSCKDEAHRLRKSANVHPDMRGLILCERVRTGGMGGFYEVLTEARKSTSALRSDLISALGCTNDPQLLDRLKDIAISREIKDEEAAHTIIAMSQFSRYHAIVALRIAKNRKWKGSNRYKETLLTKVGGHLLPKDHLYVIRKETEDKIGKNPTGVMGVKEAINEALATIPPFPVPAPCNKAIYGTEDFVPKAVKQFTDKANELSEEMEASFENNARWLEKNRMPILDWLHNFYISKLT